MQECERSWHACEVKRGEHIQHGILLFPSSISDHFYIVAEYKRYKICHYFCTDAILYDFSPVGKHVLEWLEACSVFVRL